MVNKLIILFLIGGIVFSYQNIDTYFDIEGNEIIYKDQRWRYVHPPAIDCNIPYDVFVRYIRENTNIKFQNDEEAYRYGVYKMPHTDVCPSLDYVPVIFPVNAEFGLKANWDSLKVGMTQKSVRTWFRFDPMLSFEKNDQEIWTYYGYGTIVFDKKGKLINWEFTGSDTQIIYKRDENINLKIPKEDTDQKTWYIKIINKVKNLLPW